MNDLKEIAERADALALELQHADTLYPYEWGYFLSEIQELFDALRMQALTFTTDKP